MAVWSLATARVARGRSLFDCGARYVGIALVSAELVRHSAPKQHALAKVRRVRLSHLKGTELIVPPAGRPHRVMLSQMLQSAQVDWKVAVEASGWEVMLHLVRLGMGLAVVNTCCRVPPGVVTRPLPELPALQYFVFGRTGGVTPAVKALKQTLFTHANAWKAG